MESQLPFEDVVAELKSFYAAQSGKPYTSRDHLPENAIERWSASIGEPRAVLYDLIAMFLARGFHNTELSFEFCDNVVNDIHTVITFADQIRPDVFREVFNAFDEGEYYHDGNRNEDPPEIYTRPTISRILAERSSPHKE